MYLIVELTRCQYIDSTYTINSVPLTLSNEISNGHVRFLFQTDSLIFEHPALKGYVYQTNPYRVSQQGYSLMHSKRALETDKVYIIIDSEHQNKFCQELIKNPGIISAIRDTKLESLLE